LALDDLVIEAASRASNHHAGIAVSIAAGVAIGSTSNRATIADAGTNPDVVAVAEGNAVAGVNAVAAANAAANAMDEFKNLVARMLSLIVVNNQQLSIANGNLPTIA
jgi:hypothetical protein